MEESGKKFAIEDYILRRLSAEEASKIEKAMEKDSILAKQVREEKAIQQGFQYHGQQQLLERLEGIRRKMEEEEEQSLKTRARFRLNILRIAAAVAILMLFVYGLYTFKTPEPNLFAQFYAPYEMSLATRESTPSSELEIVDQLYEQGRFQEVIPYLQRLYQKEPEDAQVLLALGISYLEENDLENAYRTFEAVRTHENMLYKDIGTWYLAMVFLKEGKTEQVKKLLQPLNANVTADKYEEATLLLKQLK